MLKRLQLELCMLTELLPMHKFALRAHPQGMLGGGSGQARRKHDKKGQFCADGIACHLHIIMLIESGI